MPRNKTTKLEIFSDILGKSPIAVESDKETVIKFVFASGEEWTMEHLQDCCEHVYLEDISGDLEDLVDAPLLRAEEVMKAIDPAAPKGADDSQQWTYYKFATIKGSVNLRWFGSSNGYYSVDVRFRQTKKPRVN